MTGYLVARLAVPTMLCMAAVAQPATAQTDDLHVIGNHSPASVWRASVARDISANLATPRLGFAPSPEGIVKVSFHADANGRIDQVSIAEPSKSPELDRAAVAAISRMRTLRPAPVSVDTGRSLQAWVYFANTDGVADRYEARLKSMSRSSLMALKGTVSLAIGVRG